MSYFRSCPLCGANLDPGEPCDCQEKESGLSAAPTTIKPKTDLHTSIISQVDQNGKEKL